jgi:hypothetical protein
MGDGIVKPIIQFLPFPQFFTTAPNKPNKNYCLIAADFSTSDDPIPNQWNPYTALGNKDALDGWKQIK